MPELFIPVVRILRPADDDHFLLFKLVDTVYAALFQTVAADFLAEAGRIRRECKRQLALGQNLIDEAANHGVFARADEIEVLTLNFVHHSLHLREAHNALHDVAVHHKRRNDVSEVFFVDHEVTRVGQHCLVQPRDIAQQIVKSHTGDAACGILVDAVKARHDIHMMRNLILRHDGVSEPRSFHIAAVVRADGHGGVDDIGDHIQNLADFAFQLSLLGVELRAALVIRFDGGIVGVDLRLQLGLFGFVRTLFELAKERPICLGEFVARGLQAFGLLLRGALSGMEGDDLVYKGKLFLLKLFADIFPDHIGIFADKFDI